MEIPVEDLLVSLTLSRQLSEYRSPSPAARAAAQLAAVGKILRPGQRVRFVYTLGEPGVHAWDLPQPPDVRSIDQERYRVLLLRAGCHHPAAIWIAGAGSENKGVCACHGCNLFCSGVSKRLNVKQAWKIQLN